MTDTPMNPKAKPDLGAETLILEEQRRRFIEAAKAAGASDDEAEFDAIVRRVAQHPRVP